jgi:putative heme iron utilization protein
MNEFVLNVVFYLPQILDQLKGYEFDKIETSVRGGGKSVYIVCAKGNYEIQVRISDHKCNNLSFYNIMDIRSNDGNISEANIVEIKNKLIQYEFENKEHWS